MFKYMESARQNATVFDDVPRRSPVASQRAEDRRRDLEEARIALRCNRRELDLVDSFVSSGEYESRSALVRAALHAFLRSRTLSTAPTPPRDSEGYVEVPVRLRPHEFEEWTAYAHYLAGNQPLRDVLGGLLRELQATRNVRDLVTYHRQSQRDAVGQQEGTAALREIGKNLQRRGVVGR